MNHFRFVLLAALLAGVAACGFSFGGASSSVLTASPVATVNGTPIGRAFYDFYVRGLTNGRSPSDLTPQQRSEALDNLIRAELLAQQAVKEGLNKNIDTASMLELSRLNVLQAAVTQKDIAKPTEEELHTEYETAMNNFPKLEYHAKHILVATQAFAEKIIQRLDHGGNFDDIAREESMDANKNNGGDLGWFTLNEMDPAFGNAVKNLKPGTYTQTPVHTQYGWHIIDLIETRDATPPPYDQARPRLEQIVEARKIKAYTDDLMRQAKIVKMLDVGTSSSSASDASDSASGKSG